MKKIIDMLKSMTNSKKKVFALALATCVIVLSIASSSIAYFTDTAKITNTFTSGNVTIELSEAKVVKGDLGHLVKDGDNRVTGTEAGEENDTYKASSLFPGQKIYKDPTIENTGDNPAYIGAVIRVTSGGIKTAYTAETIKSLFDGNLAISGASVTVKTVDGGYDIYIVYAAERAKGDKVVLFEGLTIPAGWGNDEMANLNGLQIVVEAYAVQVDGFSTPLQALQTAFDAFDGLS